MIQRHRHAVPRRASHIYDKCFASVEDTKPTTYRLTATDSRGIVNKILIGNKFIRYIVRRRDIDWRNLCETLSSGII